MENCNSRKYLDGILEKLHNVLNGLENVPGIQATSIQSSIAPDAPSLTTGDSSSKMEVDEIANQNPDKNTEAESAIVAPVHAAEYIDPSTRQS